MELLTIEHNDFRLFIECGKFEGIWYKAKGNVGVDHLTSTYSWTEGVRSATLSHLEGEFNLMATPVAPAVFFDNAEYPIWVEFNDNVTSAEFGSALADENERFQFHRQRHILSGFLNYSNDIGRSELSLIYRVDGEKRQFTLGYEVLSTKLNYHEHWREIVNDIESEYRMLTLDYLKRTFHGFSPDVTGETPELIWWNIFRGEQEKFIKACRSIIDRPRHRLRSTELYLRADKLNRVPTYIENELAEHRCESAHLYRVEQHVQSHDTPENRFLKYALSDISKHYDRLSRYIKGQRNVSDLQIEEMETMSHTMQQLRHHPFFRTVGPYKGLAQESLILQKATGYSQVYRTWNLLRRAYSLKDNLYRLQTKDIATLYEIWCFIEVSHIVRDQLHLTNADLDHRNRMEMNGLFTWDLGKGEHSRILFQKDGVELAELVYNPKHTDRENDSLSMPNLVTYTGAQKPDIVLQLTKSDLEKGMKMTYLFDAKYRISSKDGNGVDMPPDDAINQMHRYRDAIYYKEYDSNTKKKEVIGGYILFPGDGDKTQVEVSKFYKSIDEVNIGAFPLRPKDRDNRALLEDFIAQLIAARSAQLVQSVIPQKGTYVEVGNRVLMGVVKPSTRKGYLESFENGTATLYYTGPHFPTTVSLHDLHFFMPIMQKRGIRDVYEITSVRTITSREAHQVATDSDSDMRLAFTLRFHHRQFDTFRKVDYRQMKNNVFVDTTFEELDNVLSLE